MYVMNSFHLIKESLPRMQNVKDDVRIDIRNRNDVSLDPMMSNNKLNSCTFNSVNFDMVHDFGAPAQYMVPFIF